MSNPNAVTWPRQAVFYTPPPQSILSCARVTTETSPDKLNTRRLFTGHRALAGGSSCRAASADAPRPGLALREPRSLRALGTGGTAKRPGQEAGEVQGGCPGSALGAKRLASGKCPGFRTAPGRPPHWPGSVSPAPPHPRGTGQPPHGSSRPCHLRPRPANLTWAARRAHIARPRRPLRRRRPRQALPRRSRCHPCPRPPPPEALPGPAPSAPALPGRRGPGRL